MDLIENAKRIAEIDVLIKKEGTSTVPTAFNNKDNFSPSVKALVNKTLSDLKQPPMTYDLPVEIPYTNIHTQFDFIVKGSNSQLRMFEIPITEPQFDINDNYVTYLNAANVIMNGVGKPKFTDDTLSQIVMKNIKIINTALVDALVDVAITPNYQSSLKSLYDSLKELVKDENTKAEALAAAAPVAPAVGGQKGGGFNEDEVLKMETLLDITPEQIDDDIYTSSLFYTLTTTPFPKIVESTTILSKNITDLTQQLLDIDEFFQTLVTIDKKKDLLPKIQTCFSREIGIINTNLALLKPADFEIISQAYVSALSYLKTKKELQDISSTMITRDKAQEDNIIQEQIVKRANDALAGIVLIEVDTFDTPFKDKKSRNIKIVIPATKTKYMTYWYNAISDGASYTSSNALFIYKKCKKLIACDFYKDNKIKDIDVTYYDTTFITFKLKEVVPRNGEVYLIGDDNKSYNMKKCFFTTSEINKGFGIKLDDQYMVGFFFGNFKGGEKYNPGYYLDDKGFYFLNDPTKLYKTNLDFKDRSKELSTIVGCVLSHGGVTGTVESVKSDNNVITKVIFDNGSSNIEDVFATGLQLQEIYSDFNLNSVKKLVFIESNVGLIKKKPVSYRNITIYSPGVEFESTSIPLLDIKPFSNAAVKKYKNNITFSIDSDLTSKDYKMTYIKDDGSITSYKTGQLIRVSKNVEKYIFTIITSDGNRDFGIDGCFFTKYQWEKILGNPYIDYEGFFIGWCNPNNFTSITDKETPLYLPGYYWTNDANEIICNFFMDGKDEIVDDKYRKFIPLHTIISELSYDATEEQPIDVVTNDDGTISGIKFASVEISIDKIFVQQHQIGNFYPSLYNLNNLYFNSIFAPESFCKRQITIFNISKEKGVNFSIFSIILKRNMEFDISILGKQKTLTNIADENGNLYQITKILITYNTNGTSSFFFIDSKNTKYDIFKISLYENEYNQLSDRKTNSNGLIGFSLEKNTNLTGQTCDVITSSPDSFFPGYQLDNEFKLLCNSVNIPTMVNNSQVDKFLTNNISFLDLTNTVVDGEIDGYTCDNKDEIITVNVKTGDDVRIKDIKTCFVKSNNIEEYYNDYALTFEEYLNKYEIVLARINISTTVFLDTRPIWIYTFFKRDKTTGTLQSFVISSSPNCYDNIVFINSDTDINSLEQVFQLYDNTSNTSTTTKLSSIKYFINESNIGVILFNDKIILNNVFIYSYQLPNTYAVGELNAAINLKLFMINSETITNSEDIIKIYNPKPNELLYLYGYFYGNGPDILDGCTIKLLMDNHIETKATSKTNDSVKDYNHFANINSTGKVIAVDSYIQNKDMMSEIGYTDGSRKQISINKCYKIDETGIVINNTPLKIIDPGILKTFLENDETIMTAIIALNNHDLIMLSKPIITVITDSINAEQLNNLDRNKIYLLYSITNNKQELTGKLNASRAVELFGIVDPADPTKKRVIPTVKDIQNLKEDIINNLHLLPTDFTEKNSIIDGFTDAQIAELIDPGNDAKLNKLADMAPDEINDNLENMSANYLKLLVQKRMNAGEEAAFVNAIDKKLTIDQINSLKILPCVVYDALKDKIHLDELSNYEKFTYLKDMNIGVNLKDALNSITNKRAVVELLNNESIISKLNNNEKIDVLNRLGDNFTLNLNDNVTRGIVDIDARIERSTNNPTTLARNINGLDYNRLNDKLLEKNVLDAPYVQNFANALSPPNIAKLTADKIQVLRTQVGDVKLRELFSKLDKAQLESLTPDQINKLLETPEFYNIFKAKLSHSEIIQLNNPALITQLMADATADKQPLANEIIKLNNPALITQLMADATVDKQTLVDGLGDISNLDVASINALEAGLSAAQCLGIYNKVVAPNKLLPEKFNVLTKKYSSNDWYNEINLLDLQTVNDIIKIMTPQEIETKKNEIINSLSEAAWKHFLGKIGSETIFTSDAAKINALINGFGLSSVQVQRLNNMEIADLDALDNYVKEELKKNIKKDDIKLLTDLKKERLGFKRSMFRSEWSGGKTKRSKVKQNKTRRL